MSKLLANQIANYNDNGPVEAKEGLNIALNKPLQLAGSSGTAGQYLVSNGSYPIWQDLPSIPDAQVQVDWNSTTGVTSILNKPALSGVAISGSYNDLINKPTIPPAQVQVDWNAISGVTFIKNKPAFAAVATSGLYSDLTGRPSIPVSLSDFGIGSGDIDFGSYKLFYSNVFATLTELQAINAGTYHGMFAHVHSTGKAYFAHNSQWVPLANESDLPTSVPTTLGALDDVDTTGVLDGQVLKWNAASSEWQPGTDIQGTGGTGGASVSVSDTAPVGSNSGDLWWKSNEGRLKLYYADGDTNQWVDASPPLAQSNVPIAAGYITLNGTSPTWSGTAGYSVSGAQPGGAGTDYEITLTFPTVYSARTDYIVQATYDGTNYVSGSGASIGVARGTASVVFTPRRWDENPLSLGEIMVTITNL